MTAFPSAPVARGLQLDDSRPRPLQHSRRHWLAAAAAAAACWGLPPARAAEGPPAWATRPWPADKAVPPLALKGLDGRDWSLAALRGQPVLLNFWATWCGPCREEMPALAALAERHAPQGLVVLAVNYQEGEAKIREFLQQVPYAQPIALDRDGAAAKAWTPRVFPSTVLIGRDGRPQSTLIGAVDWQAAEVTAAIDRLIATR